MAPNNKQASDISNKYTDPQPEYTYTIKPNYYEKKSEDNNFSSYSQKKSPFGSHSQSNLMNSASNNSWGSIFKDEKTFKSMQMF